eukprot:TRINITY_DN6943_c0_g1_i1.p1 TRINITY_DN6943_c0_g1~~TRINITY_DN6943_c0_g1_i1.p1  ORF type:complete len:273 (-),score=42.63 TRINITY_DN6943_c0_g1_i1:8-745(-)
MLRTLPYNQLLLTAIPLLYLPSTFSQFFGYLHLIAYLGWILNMKLEKIDHVSFKVYSMFWNLPAVLLGLYFDRSASLVIFVMFFLPTFFYMYWIMGRVSISKIDDGLYLGNFKAGQEDVVRAYGIKYIVEVHDEFKNDQRVEGVEYLSMEFLDRNFVDISEPLYRAIDFIQSKASRDGNILVHCSAGVSRSASLVIGYIMASKMMTFDQALAYVVEKRSLVDPNSGFVNCLRKLEGPKTQKKKYQ